MRGCVLDTHKELFRSHSIQESSPGQSLQHQGCVGKVSGAGGPPIPPQVSGQSLLPHLTPPSFFTPHTITLSQEETDPGILASPGELQEPDRGVKPKSREWGDRELFLSSPAPSPVPLPWPPQHLQS